MPQEIEMQPVVSSQIASVGYSPETKELRVLFSKNGALYSYSDVPEDVFDNLVNAASVGQTFAATVKNAGFAYRRIG